jgi:hypothetical protein
MTTNTVFISKIPRANERSLGVEQVEDEEEPIKEKMNRNCSLNYLKKDSYSAK